MRSLQITRPMGLIVGNLAWLLLLAALVAIAARRLRLPYTVGLLAAGVAVALSPWKPEFATTKELIFTLFLPPLVFEAAFSLRWSELRSEMPPLVTMATAGVVASAAVVFLGMTRLLGWDWRPALMFATLISATDPVSVIAMLKEAKAGGRLRLFIEAESLFNDGTAAALFALALSLVAGEPISVWQGIGSFLRIAIGGLGCGAMVGGLVLFLMGRTEDHLVESMCTVVAAFGAFLFAENFGYSGVLATVMAGLMLGNIGPLRALTDKGRENAESLWELAGFIVNSLLFILMGARLAVNSYVPALATEAVAIVLVLAGRAVGVFGVMTLFDRCRYRLGFLPQTVLVWGGMRGALALALALGLPANLPMRSEVVTVVFAVVAFSTVVQGMSVPRLLRKVAEEPDGSP